MGPRKPLSTSETPTGGRPPAAPSVGREGCMRPCAVALLVSYVGAPLVPRSKCVALSIVGGTLLAVTPDPMSLANLSVNAENQIKMANEGGVEMLIELLETTNSHIQRQAAKALA